MNLLVVVEEVHVPLLEQTPDVPVEVHHLPDIGPELAFSPTELMKVLVHGLEEACGRPIDHNVIAVGLYEVGQLRLASAVVYLIELSAVETEAWLTWIPSILPCMAL